MDRELDPSGKKSVLQRESLEELARLCADVAHNPAVRGPQWETAHTLRMEYFKLTFSHDNHDEQKLESLKKRMVEFLSGVPSWML